MNMGIPLTVEIRPEQDVEVPTYKHGGIGYPQSLLAQQVASVACSGSEDCL